MVELITSIVEVEFNVPKDFVLHQNYPNPFNPAVFVATVWLLIKGGPTVGPHLQLLGQYFYGYSVSWGGSVIGALYGAGVGAVGGGLTGEIYNFVAGLRA